MSGVRFDRTGERCIIAFDIFICLLNFFYSELKSSGAIVVPNTSNYAINSCCRSRSERCIISIKLLVTTFDNSNNY